MQKRKEPFLVCQVAPPPFFMYLSTKIAYLAQHLRKSLGEKQSKLRIERSQISFSGSHHRSSYRGHGGMTATLTRQGLNAPGAAPSNDMVFVKIIKFQEDSEASFSVGTPHRLVYVTFTTRLGLRTRAQYIRRNVTPQHCQDIWLRREFQ